MNIKLLTALKALLLTFVGQALKLVLEYLTTTGAAALVGLAVHIPGDFQTGAGAFALLTAIRYFLVPVKPVPAEATANELLRREQLMKSNEMLNRLGQELDDAFSEKAVNSAASGTAKAGPYL